jgi:hypothetical protein
MYLLALSSREETAAAAVAVASRDMKRNGEFSVQPTVDRVLA